MVITGSVKKDYYVDDNDVLLVNIGSKDDETSKVDDLIFMGELMKTLSNGMKWTKSERKTVFLLLSVLGYSNRDIGRLLNFSEFIVCRELIDARKCANKIREKHNTIN